MDKKNKFSRFVKTSVIGGFVVVLPLSILIFIFKWIFGIVSSNLEPITTPILQDLLGNDQDFSLLVDLAVIIMLILVCFFIGLFVKTKIGMWLYSYIEKSFFSKIPGYKMVKETISQLLSSDRGSAFASVALCRIFGNETLVTAFVTDKHENGSYTVFVPTGPNPTSGNIYHLKPEYVQVLEGVSTEETMRSIISCGAGSQALLVEYHRLQSLEKAASENHSNDTTSDLSEKS
jgi:uncharacterized membrane protein